MQFIHESVRDFLTGNAGFEKLYQRHSARVFAEGHDRITKACVRYISIRELRHVSDTHSREGITKEWIANRLIPSYPFLSYAISFCFAHAQDAENADISQEHLLQSLHPPSYSVLETWRLWYDDYSQARYRRVYGAHTKFLHIAAQHNLLTCVTSLLDAGIDVDLAGGMYGTPLQAAVSGGHRSIVEVGLFKTFFPLFCD